MSSAPAPRRQQPPPHGLSTMPPSTPTVRPTSRARPDGKDGAASTSGRDSNRDGASSKDSLLVDLCTRATLQGNNIAVRMLEFLTTNKNPPTGFRDLADEFLELCRIMWSIEGGVNEINGRPDSDRDFPTDMESELATKLRTLNADFATLGHMLFRFLEYEKNGAIGKLQKGWRMMFADREVARMRDCLKRSREALRMSALVFKWTTGGGGQTDGNVAMGYAGLAAALERMRKGLPVVGTSPLEVLEAEAAEWDGGERDSRQQRQERKDRNDNSHGRRQNGNANQSQQYPPPAPGPPPSHGLPQLPQMSQMSPLVTDEAVDSVGSPGPTRALSMKRTSTPDFGVRDDSLIASAAAARKALGTDVSQVMMIPTGPGPAPAPAPGTGIGPDVSSRRRSRSDNQIQADRSQLLQHHQVAGTVRSRDGGGATPTGTLHRNHPLQNHHRELAHRERELAHRERELAHRDRDHASLPSVEPSIRSGAGAGLGLGGDWRESRSSNDPYGYHAQTTASAVSASREISASPFQDSVTVLHGEQQQHGSSFHRGGGAASVNGGGSIQGRGSLHRNVPGDGGSIKGHGSLHRHAVDDGDILSDSVLTEEDLFDKIETDSDDTLPTQVIRMRPDPATTPRWTPRVDGSTLPAAIRENMRTSLVTAIRTSNHKVVQDLLDRGASHDTRPESCALVDAVLLRDMELIRLLLVFGADPNILDSSRVSPLLTAVDEGLLDVAKMLLKYGADANMAAGPDDETPLVLAVTRNNIELTQLLLIWGGDPDMVMSGPGGDTALIRAMSKKAPRRLAEILLDYAADPNAKSGEGKTPLHDAIQSRRTDLMKLLLDRGCDPNLPGPKHLLWPSAYHPPCLEVMLARGADHRKCCGIMELAASLNKIESIRLLLRAGVDPNLRKDGVYTALCSSIRDNRIDIFELLLQSGADPNLMASEYPTFKAVRLHRLHMLPRLAEAGADLGSPPGLVEHCVRAGHMDTLRWVLDHGVDPNGRTEEGDTALTTAISAGRIDIMDALLTAGADPHVKGKDWPIHMAVHKPEMLARLLVDLRDPQSFRGVLERAVVAGQLDSVRQLLAAGVSVEDKNGGVFSPLTSALREERRDLVHFLLRDPRDPLGGGGADPNEPGEHLPIVKALRRCRGPTDTDMIELLLAKGAQINKMYRGWNGAMQAVENGDMKILRIVLDHAGRAGQQFDLELRDDAGRNLIDIAAGRAWTEAIDLLVG